MASKISWLPFLLDNDDECIVPLLPFIERLEEFSSTDPFKSIGLRPTNIVEYKKHELEFLVTKITMINE